jgi:hypothetical protein
VCSVPSYSISVALMEIYFASEQTEHELQTANRAFGRVRFVEIISFVKSFNNFYIY